MLSITIIYIIGTYLISGFIFESDYNFIQFTSKILSLLFNENFLSEIKGQFEITVIDEISRLHCMDKINC